MDRYASVTVSQPPDSLATRSRLYRAGEPPVRRLFAA